MVIFEEAFGELVLEEDDALVVFEAPIDDLVWGDEFGVSELLDFGDDVGVFDELEGLSFEDVLEIVEIVLTLLHEDGIGEVLSLARVGDGEEE